MGDRILMKVDSDLGKVFNRIQNQVASEIKRKYNINSVVIPATMASQILAAKHNGKKVLEFKIRKNGLNRGFLELIG
jgi:hypothetical protein